MPIYITSILGVSYAHCNADRTFSARAVSSRRLVSWSNNRSTRNPNTRDLLSLPFMSAPFDSSPIKKSEKKTPPVNGVYGQGAALKVSHRRRAVNIG
jgi:hypothetical protein